jgi:hypothetical protein
VVEGEEGKSKVIGDDDEIVVNPEIPLSTDAADVQEKASAEWAAELPGMLSALKDVGHSYHCEH